MGQKSIRNIPTGTRFFRLVVIGEPVLKPVGKIRRAVYPCLCDCGKSFWQRSDTLLSGRQKSCGCYNAELRRTAGFKHGGHQTRLYRIWQGVKRRCYAPQCAEYPRYGGRGISLCAEWFSDFSAFRDWAIQNGYSDNLEIDRIEVNGNYDPSNCRWIPHAANTRNRRDTKMFTALGETKTLAEWLRDERRAVCHTTIKKRLANGWDFTRAFSQPASK